MQILLNYKNTATFHRLSDWHHRCRFHSCRLIRDVNDSAADRPYLSSPSHLLISTGQNELTFPLSRLPGHYVTQPWLTWPTQVYLPIKYKHACRWPAYLNCTGQALSRLELSMYQSSKQENSYKLLGKQKDLHTLRHWWGFSLSLWSLPWISYSFSVPKCWATGTTSGLYDPDPIIRPQCSLLWDLVLPGVNSGKGQLSSNTDIMQTSLDRHSSYRRQQSITRWLEVGLSGQLFPSNQDLICHDDTSQK